MKIRFFPRRVQTGPCRSLPQRSILKLPRVQERSLPVVQRLGAAGPWALSRPPPLPAFASAVGAPDAGDGWPVVFFTLWKYQQ